MSRPEAPVHPSRARGRNALAGFVAVHGAIHLLGFVKAFEFAEVSPLREPIGPLLGVAWLTAAVALLAAALVVATARQWWPAGATAAALSQAVIATSWSDAAFGTVANAVILLAALHNLAAEGPRSLRTRYRREVTRRLTERSGDRILTEDALASLPDVVRRYVRMSGAVGRPRVESFRASWRGRIRGGPDDPWMEFTAEQHNFVAEPARFFMMKAKRGGLPVDVLHSFQDQAATMEGRLLSLVPVVQASGPQMTRAETVTLLNDLCVLSPGALVDPAIRWESIDERSVRATCTVGDNTVTAVLTFNHQAELVDFVSDDRPAMSADGSQFTQQRWSTPLCAYRNLGLQRIWTHGEGRWHPDTGDYPYLEGEIVEVESNPAAVAQ